MMKTILITGATDGIGLVTAEKLVELGYTVLVHGRNADKLNTLVSRLSAIGNVKGYQADLSNLSETSRLADEVAEDFDHIDVLINNAGVFKTSAPITAANYDVRFVVNLFSPYMLSQRLLSVMNKSSRIINLSSAAQSPIDFNALEGKYHLKGDFDAYAQSKLAITMWTMYMAETSDENTPMVVAVNPGSLLASKMVKEGFGTVGNDINIGRDILIEASLGDSFNDASGKYYDNDVTCFSNPHPFALDRGNRELLMSTIDKVLAQEGFQF